DTAEERVGGRCLLVGVGVEGVAGEFGEVIDVRPGHGPFGGGDRVTDPQLRQVLAERVDLTDRTAGTGRPVSGDRGEHVRSSLYRSALHVVFDAAYTTQLFSAT